jgi:hypothetical protein
MTRDEMMRLLQECGFGTLLDHPIMTENMMRFGLLVVAAEREQCAKLCEDIPLPKGAAELTHLPTIERCVNAIRARGV